MHPTSKTCLFCNQNLQPLLQKLHLTDGKDQAAGSLAAATTEGATLSPSSSSKRAEITKKQPKGDAGQIPFQLEIALIFSWQGISILPVNIPFFFFFAKLRGSPSFLSQGQKNPPPAIGCKLCEPKAAQIHPNLLQPPRSPRSGDRSEPFGSSRRLFQAPWSRKFAT